MTLVLYYLTSTKITPESAVVSLGYNYDRTALINVNAVMQNEINYEDVMLNLKQIEHDPQVIVALNETNWQWKLFDCFSNMNEKDQLKFNHLIRDGQKQVASKMIIAKLETVNHL